MRISTIIVAAGQGRRIGGDLPKQFQPVLGKPILYHTLLRFEKCTLINDVVLITGKDWLAYVSQEIVDRFSFYKVKKIVEGGAERQDSVYAGIGSLDGPPDIVIIHDAVRPFISIGKIEETIHACQKYGAAILAVPPKDTIKIARDGFVDKTLDRDLLWSVQTPQVFKYEIILKAYEGALEKGIYKTDDAALVELAGLPVSIVRGESENIKITVPSDLKLAEIIMTGKSV